MRTIRFVVSTQLAGTGSGFCIRATLLAAGFNVDRRSNWPLALTGEAKWISSVTCRMSLSLSSACTLRRSAGVTLGVGFACLALRGCRFNGGRFRRRRKRLSSFTRSAGIKMRRSPTKRLAGELRFATKMLPCMSATN